MLSQMRGPGGPLLWGDHRSLILIHLGEIWLAQTDHMTLRWGDWEGSPHRSRSLICSLFWASDWLRQITMLHEETMGSAPTRGLVPSRNFTGFLTLIAIAHLREFRCAKKSRLEISDFYLYTMLCQLLKVRELAKEGYRAGRWVTQLAKEG